MMRELKLKEIEAVAGGGCGSRIPEYDAPWCGSSDPFHDNGGSDPGGELHHYYEETTTGGGTGGTGGSGGSGGSGGAGGAGGAGGGVQPTLPAGYTPVGSGEHYMRAPDGSYHLTPEWRERVSQIHIDWRGVARDLTEITVSSIGGAGTGIRVVIGIIGGTVIQAWDHFWDQPAPDPEENTAN